MRCPQLYEFVEKGRHQRQGGEKGEESSPIELQIEEDTTYDAFLDFIWWIYKNSPRPQAEKKSPLSLSKEKEKGEAKFNTWRELMHLYGLDHLLADEMKAASEFRKAMARLLTTPSHQDVTLSLGDESIPAHKLVSIVLRCCAMLCCVVLLYFVCCAMLLVVLVSFTDTKSTTKKILSSRCPYFGAMFMAGMLESQTNKVSISEEDIKSFPAFKRFLYFLYTNKLERSSTPEEEAEERELQKEREENEKEKEKEEQEKEKEEEAGDPLEKPDELLDLLSLAEKYSLPYLKYLCEGRITEFLDTDSVVYVLNCARLYRAPSLESNCKGK